MALSEKDDPAIATATWGVPVVAIGASSGGLKALKDFFGHLPPECGIAFIVAMHLSPDHESELARILTGSTSMPVIQASENVVIAPNHVYVIAPGRYMSISGDRLHVTAQDAESAVRVIDHLFHSVAENRREEAVGVVLSGSGSDGTAGLLDMKSYGGFIMAQSPDEAEYPAMPQSIIDTGLVDLVLPADKMPDRLIALMNDESPRAIRSGEESVPEVKEDAIQEILHRLHELTGYDFSHYKRTALRRHLDRRMLVNHDEDLTAYARRIRNDDDEVAALCRNLLVRVTRFFRDVEAYEALVQDAIPRLFAVAAEDEPAIVRVWVSACSTGEEVYSLAMLLMEQREILKVDVQFQVIATDIDDAALTLARAGRYNEAAVAALSEERLGKFFIERDASYQVTDELRSLVLFATHDITRDPPFGRIDLLSCRNLLIYFEKGMQQHVLSRCAYSLREGGILFLGTAEGMGGKSQLFQPLAKKHGLFLRTDAPRTSIALRFFPVARPSGRRKGERADSRTNIAEADGHVLMNAALPDGNAGEDPTNDALIVANQEMQSLNEELRSMMEELEVAKEELQSLNEELTTVNEELQNKIEEHRRVNSDLHVLIESTHMATLFLDQELNVMLFTPESTRLFNLLPIDVGRPLEHLSHQLQYSGVLQDARKVLGGATVVDREVQDHRGNWYAMRVLPYPTADSPLGGVVLTFADITAQKKVEKVSEDRFALAFHAGPMAASIVTRDDGLFVDVNHIFEQITGFSRDEVIGKPDRSFGLSFKGEVEHAGEDRLDGQPFGGVEVRVQARAGGIHDLVVSTTAIEYEGQSCYLSLFYDVTERKRLEREILQVSDREQRRIGVDLHDGLGTHLTGVAMMTRGLARTLRAGRAVDADEMDEIARLIGDGIEQARTLAQGLNPFLLEVRGLTVALREFVAGVQAQMGVICTFEEIGSGPSLGTEPSMHLFRITQEAVTNAVRHANATRIDVTLTRSDHRYRLVIQDDGEGFSMVASAKERDRGSGMGLSIMRHRAELIGARLHVTSTPGNGTTVECFV